jgi:cysteine-rich repeat protein
MAPGCYSVPGLLPGDDGGSTDGSTAATDTTLPTSTGSSPSEPTDPSITASTSADATTTGTEANDDISVPECGNGIIDGDEHCDDGINDGSYGSCTEDCSAQAPHCGDGEQNGPEPCDDGNGRNGDGCNNDCGPSMAVLWTRTFAGDAGFTDQAFAVAADADDSIVVAGIAGVDELSGDVLLLRYGQDGALLWDVTHDLGNDSRAAGVAVGPDGEIAITGDLAEIAFLTAMFDADGELQWSDAMDTVGGGDIGGTGVGFDARGDVYAVGQVYVGNYDLVVRRYSELGASVWSETYDGGLGDDGFAIAVGADAVYVGGSTGVAAGDSNGLVRRYDLQGVSEWTREFSGNDGDSEEARGIALDPAGYLVASGFSADDEGLASGWIRKYDLDGAQQWTTWFDEDPLGSALFSVAVDDAGQIAVVGVVDLSAPNPFVAKLAPDGARLWTDAPLEAPAFIWGVTTDAASNVVICGASGDDVWLQKYAP